MKKTLYSTTALAAAGLFALTGTDAAAQNAPEKISLGLGGFMKSWVSYSEQESAFEDANNAHYGSMNIINDSEVYFRGNTTLDNGVRVDVVVQLETDQARANSGSVIDETYLKLTGGFGDLRMGSTKGASFVLGKNAPINGIIHSYNPDTLNFVINPNGQAFFTAAVDIGAGDHMKIAYFTPKMSGFQAGVTYVPSTSNSDTPAISGGAASGTSAETSLADLAITYDGNFGDASVGVTGAVWKSDGSGTSDYTGYSIGAKVGFAGFTIGGRWGEHDDDQGNVTTGSSIADQESYNLGVSYKTGAWTVGASVGHREAPVTEGSTRDDSSTVYSVGAKYNIGPGVDVGGNILMAEYEDTTTAAGSNNEGWAVVAGVNVAF